MAENPTEHLQEQIHHHAQHAGERWIMGVAVSSAILAALAAVASLLETHHGHEAMLDRIKAADHWAFYQAKSIKGTVLKSKMEVLAAMGKRAAPADAKKLEEYAKDGQELMDQATELEDHSARHFKTHLGFARAVTLLQVSIAVGAVAVLARRIRFWYVSLAFGTAGLCFLISSLFL